MNLFSGSQFVYQILPVLAVPFFAALPLKALKPAADAGPDISRKLFCILLAASFVSFCHLYAKLLTAPWALSHDADTAERRILLVCLGLCVLHGVIFFRSLTVKLPALLNEQAFLRSWRYLNPLPLALTLLLLWVSPRDAGVVMTGRVRATTMLFLTLVPPFAWLLIHGAWYIATSLSENERFKAENALLQIEGKRLRELREYLESTRVLRHDFRQHLGVIRSLAGANQIDELNYYLNQYYDSISETRTHYCENSYVDAIAAHYDALAAMQETTISWSLKLPGTLFLPDTDYCSILGNLVENALRAVKTLPEEKREITVLSQMLSEEMLGISVKNPYGGELQLDRDGLPRSERDRTGIGLSSVSNTVRRHHGTLDISAKDGTFTVMVTLNRAG